jgi:[acyl-carrier-protein] S-malonyltransferase
MKISFIFPGQGSQSIGMGQDFFENSDIAKEMIEKASVRVNFDFKELMFENNNKLSQTTYTQPAILLVSCIANEIFKSKCDSKPEFTLGHSLGEFSALVASGAINYLDAVELVHKRGQFMSDACDSIDAGMMAILGMNDEDVQNISKEALGNGKQVWVANYNNDDQVVLAGLKLDLKLLVNIFKAAGAKRAIILPMSVASHCPILEPVAKKLLPYLKSSLNNIFKIPVISNVTAKLYNTKEEAVPLLVKQLTMPVLYKQSIQNNMNDIDLFIEFGNGSVLKGLNKKGVKVPTICVNNMDTLNQAIEKINE